MANKRISYLVLDCETATLPCASYLAKDEDQKKKIATAKPLIYDLGWQVVQRDGTILSKKQFLIAEVFSVYRVFRTAYYKEKRPLYINMLNENQIEVVTWKQATAELEKDLASVDFVGAFNSEFDFKKAIPFTEKYTQKLYSNNFEEWMFTQEKFCKQLLTEKSKKVQKAYEPEIFTFRGKSYKLFDLWGMSCQTLLNNNNFKNLCFENNYFSNSGNFFTTNAETTYRYLFKNLDFTEAHTALNDAEIESEILVKILQRQAVKVGIISFPSRQLGHPVEFVLKSPKTQKAKRAKIALKPLVEYAQKAHNKDCTFYREIIKEIKILQEILEEE